MSVRRLIVPALAAATALGLAACGSSSSGDPFATGSSTSGGGSSATAGGKIVVGSANFPESELLMQIYAQALSAKGIQVETKPNIGSREIYMKAFADGDISLLPEYNGALLSFLIGKDGIPKEISSTEQVDAELAKRLPAGAEVLDSSAAEDKDTVTVTKETADKYHLKSLADLKPVANELTFGAGAEWTERYQGKLGLKEVYGIEFKAFKPLDSGGPLSIAALKNGDIQASDIFSTDPAIVTNGWVSLEDPQHLYTAQNVVPYIKTAVATDQVKATLDAVSKALTTQSLSTALAKVVNDKVDPVTVAKDFLTANSLG